MIRALTILISLLSIGEAHAALPRVVSTGVCADQYLLALAAPEQIAGLSPDARDPALSAGAQAAQRFPALPLNAESILLAHPDIVLTEGFVSSRMAPFLVRQGIRFETLPTPETLDGVEQALREIGALIGRAQAGEAAARALAAARAALAQQAPADPPGALYLLPTGTTAGARTYIDEVMRLGGFANIAARQGVKGWDRVPLETLVEAPPRIVIASFFDLADTTALAGFAATPLARRTLAGAQVISVPNALWVCAGPTLLDAARYLQAHNHALLREAP